MPTLVEVPNLGKIEFPDGMSHDDITSSIKNLLSKKGGEQTNENAESKSDQGARSQGDAERTLNGKVNSALPDGTQASDQPRPQDQGQPQRGDEARVSGDIFDRLAEGGEKDAKQKDAKAEDGYGSQVRQEDRQGVRGQEDAGKQAEVKDETSGVQPPAQGFMEEIKTPEGRKAAIASALEEGIPMALGSVAAGVVGPAATAGAVPFVGPAAPLVGVGAGGVTFLATQELAKKIFVKPVESVLGIKEDIEAAQAAAPTAAKYGGYAGMAPFAIESAAGFLKTGAEAAAGAAEGQAVKEAAKAVWEKAAAGFAGGVAFEPIRYGFEATEKAAGITDEAPKPITKESALESGLMGLVLGGKVEEQKAKNEAGKKEIADAGLPETADVASQIKPDTTIEKENATKTGEIKEDGIGEYPKGNEAWQATEAGYSHSFEPTAEGQEKIEGNRIYAAAYRDPNTGIVHIGVDHETAEGKAKPEEEVTKNASERNTGDYGFVTDKGEFISREDAEKIARENGQYWGNFSGQPVMHSTDLALDIENEPKQEEAKPRELGGAAAKTEFDKKRVIEAAKLLRDSPTPFDRNDPNDFEKFKQEYTAGFDEGTFDGPEGEAELRNIYDKAHDAFEIHSKDPSIPIVRAVERIGMEPPKEDSVIGISNQKIDEQRKAMGLPPITDTLKRTWGAAHDEAANRIQDNPQYASDLLKDLKDSNRSVNDVELAALAQNMVETRNRIDKNNKLINSGNLSETELAAKMQENRVLQENHDDLDRIIVGAKSETARGLNFSKALFRSDFSLAAMKSKARAARGGKKLTPEEESKIEEDYKNIKNTLDAEDKAKENQAKKGERKTDEAVKKSASRVQRIVKSLKASKLREEKTRETTETKPVVTSQKVEEAVKAKTTPTEKPASVDPAVQKIFNLISKSLSEKADSARERIRQRRREGRLMMGLDPVDLADHAIIGADYILKGTSEFVKWSNSMINEFGDYVKPHLNQIFEAAKKQAEQEAKEFITKNKIPKEPKVKKEPAEKAKKVSEMSPEELINRYKSIIESKKEDPQHLGSPIEKLLDAVVQRELETGKTEQTLDRKAAVNEVHEIVKSVMGENWSLKETQDALSRIGQFRKLSEKASRKIVFETKGYLLQLGKIRFATGEATGAPELAPKTASRREINAQTRRAAEAYRNVVKKFNLVVKDPESQLKGHLDGVRTRIKNRIEDLKQAIVTGVRKSGASKEKEYPEDIKQMQRDLQSLEAQYEIIYGKKQKQEPTYEQKVAASERAYENLIEKKEQELRDLQRGILPDSEKGEKITSEKIERHKAELETLRSEINAIKEADSIRREEQKQIKYSKRIDFLKKVLAGGKVTKEDIAEYGPDSADVAILKDEIAALEKQRDALKPKKTEDEKFLNSLKNKLSAREKKLAEIQNEIKKVSRPKQLALKEEEQKIQNQIDDVNKQINEYREAAKLPLKTAEERKITSLERQIKNKQKQLQEKTIKAKAKPIDWNNPDITRLTQELKSVSDQMKSEDWYMAARAKMAVDAYTNRKLKQRDEYLRRIEEKDFAPKTRTPYEPEDEEAQKAAAEAARAKLEWEARLREDQWKNASTPERVARTIVAWKRAAVLSYIKTLFKLASATAEVAVYKPLDVAVGTIIGKLPVLNIIAEKSAIEGRAGRKDIDAYVKGFLKGAREFKNVAQGKPSEIEALFDKPNYIPAGILGFPGNIHAAVKNPTFRANYELGLRRYFEFASDHGLDIEDPSVQRQAELAAYKYAQRSIFKQDNTIVKSYNAINSFLKKNKYPIVRAFGYLADEFLPIVKVPTNFFLQALEYQFVGISGLNNIRKAAKKGLENITPEEADVIMRQMKNGSVGLTLMAIGWALPEVFGGFYVKGQQKDDDKPKNDAMKVAGQDIEKTFLDHPAFLALRIGATVRNYWDDNVDETMETGEKLDTLRKGIAAAELGLISELPFTHFEKDFGKYTDFSRMDVNAGEIAKSNIPGFVQEFAGYLDRDEDGNVIKRSPEGFVESIKMGLPVLRQQVQEK